MSGYNFVSLVGILALMALAWAMSTNRRRVNWRVVGWGVGLQLVFAMAIFVAPGTSSVFLWLNNLFLGVLQAATAGQRFLFGSLASADKVGFVLAFQALPTIVFFSALMGLLYYVRVMPLLIRGFAWVFARTMRISGAESLCAASNIFVGVESATSVRPYLAGMTRSELCTILTAGMATVASSTLGVYVGALHGTFPTIAGHLMSASILSAPAAIVMSKLLLPEDGAPATLGRRIEMPALEESSAVEAIINGAMAGVKLVVGVCALLIAFLGMVALANLAVGAVGGWFGATGAGAWSLHKALGYVMYPVAVAMGVPPVDAGLAGSMLGERLVATEIPAYFRLAGAIQANSFANPRSVMIVAYGLCGFAHVASLAIFVGGIAALAPERRKDLAAVGPRALLAANLACFMTGAVAGVFYHHSPLVLQAATGG